MLSQTKKFENDLNHKVSKKLKLTNYYQVPKIDKVVVSSGIGAIKEDKNAISLVSNDLALITGQKPKINLSKKSVSAFKLRNGQPVGLTVTLRGRRMYDFLSRLTNIAIPRIRDFKGLNEKAFDKQGNYCIGILEHIIMPEIKYDTTNQYFGFQVNICTTAKNIKEAKTLLSEIGFPFSQSNNKV